jgi:hypothetical protein
MNHPLIFQITNSQWLSLLAGIGTLTFGLVAEASQGRSLRLSG